jgi:hypothetical protein
LATKRDTGSLDGTLISRNGFRLEAVVGKQTDLTPLLLLVPETVPVAELAPEIAEPQHALVADLPHEPSRAGDTVFAQGIRRLRQLLGSRGGGAR